MKKRKNSKSAFIKAQSMTKSAKDVITEAKAVGLEISADYVHSVRSEMRRGAAARAHVPFGKKTPVTKTRKSSKKTIFNAVKTSSGTSVSRRRQIPCVLVPRSCFWPPRRSWVSVRPWSC